MRKFQSGVTVGNRLRKPVVGYVLGGLGGAIISLMVTAVLGEYSVRWARRIFVGLVPPVLAVARWEPPVVELYDSWGIRITDIPCPGVSDLEVATWTDGPRREQRVIIGTGEASDAPGIVTVYDWRGERKGDSIDCFKEGPAQRLWDTGISCSDCFQIDAIHVMREWPRPRAPVFVTARDPRWALSRLIKLDPLKPSVEGSLWHCGRIEGVMQIDLDGDGTDELVVWAKNNLLADTLKLKGFAPVVFALKPDSLTGDTQAPSDFLSDKEQAKLLWYVVFPPAPGAKRSGEIMYVAANKVRGTGRAVAEINLVDTRAYLIDSDCVLRDKMSGRDWPDSIALPLPRRFTLTEAGEWAMHAVEDSSGAIVRRGSPRDTRN